MARCVVAVVLSIGAMFAIHHIFSQDPARQLAGYALLIAIYIPLVLLAILEHYEAEMITRCGEGVE